MKQKWKRSEERRKNRLSQFNYSDEEFYFVTICIKDRLNLFGNIAKEKMILNKWGFIAKECWQDVPNHFNNIWTDVFVIMPNHIHGIIKIGDPCKYRNHCVGTRHALSLRKYEKLPIIIGSFKSSVTRKIHRLTPDISFHWQRSYYDHIIRNEKDLERIREYIRFNPTLWEKDELFNP